MEGFTFFSEFFFSKVLFKKGGKQCFVKFFFWCKKNVGFERLVVRKGGSVLFLVGVFFKGGFAR